MSSDSDTSELSLSTSTDKASSESKSNSDFEEEIVSHVKKENNKKQLRINQERKRLKDALKKKEAIKKLKRRYSRMKEELEQRKVEEDMYMRKRSEMHRICPPKSAPARGWYPNAPSELMRRERMRQSARQKYRISQGMSLSRPVMDKKMHEMIMKQELDRDRRLNKMNRKKKK